MSTVTWEKKLQRDKVKQQEKVKKDRDTPGPLHLCLMSALCRNIFSFSFSFFLYLLIIALSFHGCSQNWGLLRASVAHIFVVVVVVVDFVSYLCFPASHSPLPSVRLLFAPSPCFVSCPFTLTHIAANYSNVRRVVSLLRHTAHQTAPTYGRQDIHTVNGARTVRLLHCGIWFWGQSCIHAGINKHKHINE